MTQDKKGKKNTRPLGALRSMPIVDPDLRRKVKQKQQRPSTAMSMKDYLDNEEDKQKRVDDMQDRVNEAVRDYMSNLIQNRAIQPPAPQQQIIIAQPITVPIRVPVAAPANPLESFVSTGLELLENDMPTTPALRPTSPAKSFVRLETTARPVSVKSMEPPQRLVVHEEPDTVPRAVSALKPRPHSPAKSVRPPSARPASSVKVKATQVKVDEKGPAKAVEEEEKQEVPAGLGDIKRPDEKFDRHWLTWPRTPASQSERSKTPAPSLHRPKNPAKLRRSKTSFDRPVFTPVPNEFVELDPRPPTGEPHTLNFIPGEPGEYGRAVPYVPAFQSWMKSASNEDKDVVYKMMKTLKAQPTNGGPSHARYVSYSEADRKKQNSSFGVRTSLPAFKPPEMYQVPDGQHHNPCNSCDDYLIKTWAHQVGTSPEFYGIGYSRYYHGASTYGNDFNFARNTFNWEDSKPYAAPSLYRNVQYRPMAKHQSRPTMQKDYHHENSHFQDAQRPYRSHFIIFPDWVSENAHFKKQRQVNGHRYH